MVTTVKNNVYLKVSESRSSSIEKYFVIFVTMCGNTC